MKYCTISLFNTDFVFGLQSIISEIIFDAENDAILRICLSHLEKIEIIDENWWFCPFL